jgi:putative lipoprotein
VIAESIDVMDEHPRSNKCGTHSPRPHSPRRRRSSAFASLGLLLLGVCSPSTARAQDSWWGRDKLLHFGISAGLGAAGYGLGSFVFESRVARTATGAGIALGAGIAKESYDALGYGDPSLRDLTWDLAGTAVGVGIALAVDLALGAPHASSGHAPTALLVRF